MPSSKQSGPSLNECLHSGTSLTTPLFDVLLRFRVFKYAFSSDIEKAFLQIILNEHDRDFVRFIWYKDLETLNFTNRTTREIGYYRLCRVIFGVTSSPFLMCATLLKHMESYLFDPEFVDKLIASLHMDDLISGSNSLSVAVEFLQKSKQRLSTAGFNLRKFHSNFKHGSILNEHFNSDGYVKVLGLLWDKVKDEFVFSFKHLLKDKVD